MPFTELNGCLHNYPPVGLRPPPSLTRAGRSLAQTLPPPDGGGGSRRL